MVSAVVVWYACVFFFHSIDFFPQFFLIFVVNSFFFCHSVKDCGKGVERNMNTALKWYRRAADQGQCAGQWETALAMLTGVEGRTPKIKKGIRYMRLAAAQGESRAVNELKSIQMTMQNIDPSQKSMVKFLKQWNNVGGRVLHGRREVRPLSFAHQ